MIKACRIWIKNVPSNYNDNDEEGKTKKHIIYDRDPKDILSKIGDCITLN